LTRLELKVELEEGLHTRPAGLIAELFENKSGRMLTASGEANISSMLSIMTLGVKKGEIVIIETEQDLEPVEKQKLIEILSQ